MKRVALLGAIYLLTCPAFSDGQLHRYKGLRHLSYDLRTGEITWLDNGTNQTRSRRQIWSASVDSGFFWGSGAELGLDWGDLPDAATNPVTQFEFAYATDSRNPSGVEADVSFYVSDNGGDSVGRVLAAGFRFRGLPAIAPDDNVPNDTAVAFAVRVAIDATPMSLAGPDLDGPNAAPGNCVDVFGASDFSYAQRYRRIGDSTIGPLLSAPDADPNVPPCPGLGSVDLFDWYSRDPNNPPADPNAILQPDSDYVYFGSFWFGVFTQFHLTLWTGEPNGTCPQEGCSTDLDGDCTVALADLAIVLSNFGQTEAGLQGDFDGDGEVNLADLALILSEFGNDCN